MIAVAKRAGDAEADGKPYCENGWSERGDGNVNGVVPEATVDTCQSCDIERARVQGHGGVTSCGENERKLVGMKDQSS